MEIRIAVSKIDKYGNSDSGDTVEVIERPNGGISIVMADGLINGKSHKSISTMVSHRVIDNISNGVRDGAAIRAVSSRIFSENQGNVSADLNVISVDLVSYTILISRNNPTPVFLVNDGKIDCLSAESEPIGGRADINPSIVELQIQPGMAIIAFSDGVYHAGSQTRHSSDICTTIEAMIDEQEPSAQEMADFLLNRSIRLDESRPKDDMSVMVLLIAPQSQDRIRRMRVSFTLDE